MRVIVGEREMPPSSDRWRRVVRRGALLLALLVAAGAIFLGVATLRLLRAADRDVRAQIQQAPAMQVELHEQHTDSLSLVTHLLQLEDDVGRTLASIRMPPPGPHPARAIVILGGIGTGRRAVDLLEGEPPYVLAALDYAYDGPRRTTGVGFVARLPQMQRDFVRTGVALRDLVRAVRALPGVDPDGVYVLGASLGAPIACAAAAADPPAGLVLLYGFADHTTLLEHRLRPFVGWRPLRNLLARFGGRVTRSLDARHFLPELCGTPVLVVSSPDDRDLPRACSEALWAAVCAPRQRVQLEGGHIEGDRKPEILRQVIDVVQNWLEE
jgi:hypothetical protein